MKGMKVNTENLLKLIQASPLKNEEIAGRAGISVQMFSYIKNGKKGSTYPTLKKIADVLNVPVDVLIVSKAPDINKQELEWLQILHEANARGLGQYIDGLMEGLKHKEIKEDKVGDTPAVQGQPPSKYNSSSGR
ncbi:MAG: helix-turn-helix domain-containing protein [Syntrophorhabdaceae bacterium]